MLQLARFGAVAGACAIVAATAPARAEEVTDAQGDFQQLFVDAHPGLFGEGQTPGDLDVKSAAAFFDGTTFTLTATMFGDIGTTEGGLYVWGVDSGRGFDFFETQPNPTGDGVKFDSVIVLNTDSSGLIARNLVFGPGEATFKPILADDGAITINGDTITVRFALADLPSQGLDPLQFGFNIWPRLGGLNANTQIADFAPDASDLHAAYVPEPAAWALMIGGFGGVGSVLRRRRRLALA